MGVRAGRQVEAQDEGAEVQMIENVADEEKHRCRRMRDETWSWRDWALEGSNSGRR